MTLEELQRQATELENAIDGWACSTLDSAKCKQLFQILDTHATACGRLKDRIYNRFRTAREIERNGIARTERHP